MDENKAPVTRRSLLQRLNRRLAQEAKVLKKSREGRGRADLGEYYLVDLSTNTVHARHVDPLALADELHILARWETLLEEEA